jgi:hypothetical protein
MGPQLIFNPSSVDFGDVKIGNSVTILVNATNIGDDPCHITGISVSDSQVTQDQTPGTVLSGHSLSMNVTFTPTGAALVIATITIASDSIGNPDVLSVTGEGFTSGKLLSINPGSWDYGNQKDGVASAEKLFVLKNAGDTTITITTLDYNDDFSAGGTQPSLPYTLNPAATVNVGVIFTPSVTGLRQAANGLEITSDAVSSPDDVALSGTGFLITPAYVLSAGIMQPIVGLALGGVINVKAFDPANLNSEEVAVFNRLHHFGLPGVWKSLERVYVKYEDLGAASIEIQGITPLQTKAITINLPTVGGTGTLLTTNAELIIDGEDIFIQIRKVAGAVQIVQLLFKFEDDVQLLGTSAIPTTVTSAFDVTGVMRSLMAFSGGVVLVEPANTDSEETSVMKRTFDYDPTNPGYEQTLVRIFLHYENLGVAQVQVIVSTTRQTLAPVVVTLGTNAADQQLYNVYFDVVISGDVISVELDRMSGPVSIASISHRIIDRGEVVEDQ